MKVSYYEDEYVSGWRENFIYKLPSGEVVAIYNDITERMRAQEALKQSEEKLRVIFESIKDAITIIDLKGFIIDANEASMWMSG
jgi:PAS domain-containing protein